MRRASKALVSLLSLLIVSLAVPAAGAPGGPGETPGGRPSEFPGCEARGLQREGTAPNGMPLCSHGGDPQHAVWTNEEESSYPALTATDPGDPTDPTTPPPCATTNPESTDSNLLEIIYVVPSNLTNSHATDVDTIRKKAERADRNLDASTNSVDQHFRLLCNSYSNVVVRNVTIIRKSGYFKIDANGNCVYQGNINDPKGSFTTSRDVICSLQNQVSLGLGSRDYESTGRVYGIFVDDTLSTSISIPRHKSKAT